MTNPYASPTADVIENNDSSLGGLPRFSTWAVFFLMLFTMGLYTLYWLYNRTATINESVTNKIPVALIHLYVGLTVISWVFQIAVVVNPELTILALLTPLVSIAAMVFYYMVIYKMRNRICDDMLSTSRWGGIKTFFFSALYLNYKINEAHDNA